MSEKLATKKKDIAKNISYMEYAQMTKGVYVNLLNGCSYNEKTGQYETLYLISEGGPLFGKKIKMNNGEYTCIYSCLGTSYRDDPEIRKQWKEARDGLINDYKDQVTLESHIKTNNIDLKKLNRNK